MLRYSHLILKAYDNIIISLKQLLGDEIFDLFGHACFGCDTTYRVFQVGNKTIFHKVVKDYPVL